MSTLVFPSLVRGQVLEQHIELRALLERAVADADRAAVRPAPDGDGLAEIARELCERFRDHLAFEEGALRPVFLVLDAWGPERVRELETEHARQKRELDTLLAKIESGEDLGGLAVAVGTLAADLLRDMDDEEQGCLGASAMSAGHLTFERR